MLYERQKRQVGYLHLPVCTYCCMAGRRLEVGKEATNVKIHGNSQCRVFRDAAQLRCGGLDREGIHILVHGTQPPHSLEVSFDLDSLSKI